MGCRQSTELLVPVLKYGAARQDVERMLPSLVTQGGFYKVAQPNTVHANKPVIASNKGTSKGPQNEREVTERPLKSKHTPDKLPTNTSHDLVETARHQLRSGPKDWIIVFVLGGPGCGKGTQCQRIVQDFGFLHLSAGDLLRAEVRKGTAIGQDCERLMKEGKLVPLEVTLSLLENAMNSASQKKFLIDGFPRAVDQAKAFEKKVSSVPPPELVYNVINQALRALPGLKVEA